MITDKDVVLALSIRARHGAADHHSIIKRLGIPLIALTGDSASNLALEADVHIDVGVAQEACPSIWHQLPVPLPRSLWVMRWLLPCWKLEDSPNRIFARSHPGGSLRRRLLLHISDIMHSGRKYRRWLPRLT